MRPVPTGSLWRVLPFVAPAYKQRVAGLGMPNVELSKYASAVRGWLLPEAAWSDRQHVIDLNIGDCILVGDTVVDPMRPTHLFVEVLLPVRCYLNRTHFNPDSEYLERVA